MANNLFITGRVRCGKSTLLKELIDPFKEVTGGFFVQRLFIDNESKAFRMVNLTREKYLPNRDVPTLDDFTDLIAIMDVDRKIQYDVFRTVGVEALREAVTTKQLVLMDELGKMEIKVPEFTQTVFEILDAEIPVMGVLKKDDNPFLNKIKSRPDVTVLDMDDEDINLVRAKLNQFIAQIPKLHEFLSKALQSPSNGIYKAKSGYNLKRHIKHLTLIDLCNKIESVQIKSKSLGVII